MNFADTIEPYDTVQQSWAGIDHATQSMRAAAQTADWSRVLEMSSARHDQLKAHFLRFPVGPDNADFYQTHLTEMLKGERELQRLATDARREIMRESVIANHNHRAVGAYLQN